MKEVIEKWINELKDKLYKKYVDSGLIASGKWGKGLETNVIGTDEKIKAELYGEKYTGVIVYGRKPTAPNKRGRLYGIILKWIDDKKLRVDNKKRFAYFVSKRIDEEGIKVPNRYNDGSLLSDIEPEIEKLKDLLKNEMSIEVYSDVLKEFKK